MIRLGGVNVLISLPCSTEGKLFINQTSDCQLIKMTLFHSVENEVFGKTFIDSG